MFRIHAVKTKSAQKDNCVGNYKRQDHCRVLLFSLNSFKKQLLKQYVNNYFVESITYRDVMANKSTGEVGGNKA